MRSTPRIGLTTTALNGCLCSIASAPSLSAPSRRTTFLNGRALVLLAADLLAQAAMPYRLLAQAPSSTADPYAPGRAIVADIDKIVTPHGVQESFDVTLGGAREAVSVRGADRDNPLLLFVHGGPGAVEMPVAWAFQRPWEDFFTVVQWDQRGAGKSFPLNDPKALAPTLTVDRYRDDAIELIEFLCRKYHKQKVVLLGHSWGSIVGLSVAIQRPDLLYAYIGMGQVINFRENERVAFAWTLAQARQRGDEAAIHELRELEPYPGSGPFANAKIATERKWAIRYGALAAGRDNADFYFNAPLLSPEYTPADVKAWGDGSKFTIDTLLPQLADVNFQAVTRLRCPVFLFLGRHDETTPALIADAWLRRVGAPKKAAFWFEHSAHLPMIEEPGRVLQVLVDDIRPLAALSAK